MPHSTSTVLSPLYPDKQSLQVSWAQLHGCSQDLLIANAAKEYKGLIVLVTPVATVLIRLRQSKGSY